jgi:hypothetical protein
MIMGDYVVGQDRGVVKIGQNSWTVRPMTRSATKASAALSKMDDLGDKPDFEELDAQAVALIEYLDKRLAGDSDAGGVLKTLWADDQIGIDDLSSLAEYLSADSNGNGANPQ